jgi:hypothetical protein
LGKFFFTFTLNFKALKYLEGNMKNEQALEEIAFIKQVIADSQRLFIENGHQYILWSGLAIVGILLKYVNEGLNLGISSLWIWAPILLLGWVLSLLLKKRTYLKIRSKTFAQKIFETTWTALLISIVILALVGFYTKSVQTYAVSAVIATMFGCGYFISGTLTDSKWMKGSSFAWWIFAVLMFLYPGRLSVAFLGLMLIFFQLIPGIILSRDWRKKLGNQE